MTRVVDRRRSVELHQTPVVHVPGLTPGHSLVAGHAHVQKVDLVPRAGQSLDHSLDPGQKVVHAHVRDQGVDHDQGAAHGLDQGVAHGLGQGVALSRDQEVAHDQDQGVGHIPGVHQDLGRVHHALGLGQRVGQGVADHPILDQGNG